MCDMPVVLKGNISLQKLIVCHLKACRGSVQVRELEVKHLLSPECLEMMSGITSICVHNSTVHFAEVLRRCPDLTLLTYPHSRRFQTFHYSNRAGFDLSHSGSLQKLCIHSDNQMPWKVPPRCAIERSDKDGVFKFSGSRSSSGSTASSDDYSLSDNASNNDSGTNSDN